MGFNHSAGAPRRLQSSAVSDMKWMTSLCRTIRGRPQLYFFIAGIICGLVYSGVLPAAKLSTSFRTMIKLQRVISDMQQSRLPPVQCTSNGTSRQVWLLIVVFSTPDPHGEKMRLAARNTWITHRIPPTIKLVVKFVLGTKGLHKHQIRTLNNEQRVYKDLLLFEDHIDGYYHLTTKLQLSVLWAIYNEQFDYLVKTDDDVAVNLYNMVEGLIKLGCPGNLYWGRFIQKKPETKGKWKETNWPLCNIYIPYCAGLGYVLGRQAVEAIAPYGRYLRQFKFEDVSMSLWLSPYNLMRIDSQEEFQFRNNKCNKGIIMAHRSDLPHFKASSINIIKFGRLCNNTSE